MTPPETSKQPLKSAGQFSLFLFALAVLGHIAAIGLVVFCPPFGVVEFGSFLLVGALMLSSLILLFVVVPNAWLYQRTRDRRARMSLWLGGVSLAIILLYILALLIPHH